MEAILIIGWWVFWIWIATSPWNRWGAKTEIESPKVTAREIHEAKRANSTHSTPKPTKQRLNQQSRRVNPAHVRNRIKEKKRPVFKPSLSPHDIIVHCYLANREQDFVTAVDEYEQSDLIEHHYECSDSFDELNIGDLKQYEDDVIKADETCPADEVGEELFNKQPFKSDYREIQIIVKNKGVQLFHFTDRSNIRLIKELSGLYSWDALNHIGVQAPNPGGSDISRKLDLRKNLQDYVRLCFHPDHPMKYVAQRDGRVPNPVMLEIDPEVLYWERTLYSNVNAAAGNANIGGTLNEFDQIDFDLCNSGIWTSEHEKHHFQAEVLVETFIHTDYILNIDDF